MKKIISALALVVFVTPAAFAQGKLNVVTTTEDLASIGREVGGDRITIESIARGYQDPHFVEAKPSFILKLQRADRELELEQQFVCRWSVAVRRPPVLPAYLAELARPVGQQERLPCIEDCGVHCAIGAIDADAGKPAASELVIT